MPAIVITSKFKVVELSDQWLLNPRGKEKTAQGDACAVAFVEPTQVRFEKSQRIVPVEQSHVRLISASFAS
ncbi:hypothetical protein [Limosilactobacillus ingluviei]|uniref:hypothetical protein n=1 Tax=Limosilactobacillus ingluviei TaxID=148604 RepID=UPI0024BBC58E|nr:hypothetical protein [Limosilactobacillus ingluviei]